METWSAAMERALYGPEGFYTACERGPARDFRTSSTASIQFARAVLELITRVDEALGNPDRLDFVEVAAASGVLLEGIRALAEPTLLARLRLTGVERRVRPTGLHDSIGWTDEVAPLTGVLFANEWLDNIPLDDEVLTGDGVRQVHSDDSIGQLISDTTWTDRWWPLTEIGDRAELGETRDRAWADAVRQLERGVAVTADYCTFRDDRETGSYPMGTLTGYRDGRQCEPIADGSCDLTAHVAIDAVALAVEADTTLVIHQRGVLKELGITGARPSIELAGSDPSAYSIALARAGEEGELLDPGGLGAMTWLLHIKGCPVPWPLKRDGMDS